MSVRERRANGSHLVPSASDNLAIKNISTQTIFAPLRIEVTSISSASGSVTVANADNAKTGAGALWDFSNYVGTDNVLSAGELSGLRTLAFNNSANEAFTVTFNVIGNLPNPGNGSSSPTGSRSGGSGSGSSGASTVSNITSTVTSMVIQVTYNPLLNTVTVQLK